MTAHHDAAPAGGNPGRPARTAQQTAQSDQAMAFARDIAAGGTTVPIVLEPSDGRRCTWCDCPDGPDSPHNDPEFRCSGCPDESVMVVCVFAGPNKRLDFPACEEHHAHIIASVAQMIRGDQP